MEVLSAMMGSHGVFEGIVCSKSEVIQLSGGITY